MVDPKFMLIAWVLFFSLLGRSLRLGDVVYRWRHWNYECVCVCISVISMDSIKLSHLNINDLSRKFTSNKEVKAPPVAPIAKNIIKIQWRKKKKMRPNTIQVFGRIGKVFVLFRVSERKWGERERESEWNSERKRKRERSISLSRFCLIWPPIKWRTHQKHEQKQIKRFRWSRNKAATENTANQHHSLRYWRFRSGRYPFYICIYVFIFVIAIIHILFPSWQFIVGKSINVADNSIVWQQYFNCSAFFIYSIYMYVL